MGVQSDCQNVLKILGNPVQGKRYRKNTAKESVMQGICSKFCKIDILFARQCVPLLLTIYE